MADSSDDYEVNDDYDYDYDYDDEEEDARAETKNDTVPNMNDSDQRFHNKDALMVVKLDEIKTIVADAIISILFKPYKPILLKPSGDSKDVCAFRMQYNGNLGFSQQDFERCFADFKPLQGMIKFYPVNSETDDDVLFNIAEATVKDTVHNMNDSDQRFYNKDALVVVKLGKIDPSESDSIIRTLFQPYKPILLKPFGDSKHVRAYRMQYNENLGFSQKHFERRFADFKDFQSLINVYPVYRETDDDNLFSTAEATVKDTIGIMDTFQGKDVLVMVKNKILACYHSVSVVRILFPEYEPEFVTNPLDFEETGVSGLSGFRIRCDKGLTESKFKERIAFFKELEGLITAIPISPESSDSDLFYTLEAVSFMLRSNIT